MTPRLTFLLGSLFVVDEIDDLELLTELLYLAGEHLNVVFAVASYVQRVPDGMRHFRPAMAERVSRSIEMVARGGSMALPLGSLENNVHSTSVFSSERAGMLG